MRIFLLSISILLYSNLKAQTDTIFWFAAPEVSQSTAPFDEDILINITGFENPTTVSIDKPADPSFAPIIITLAPNSTQELNLTPWKDELENKPENTVLNYGLRIQSNHPILAYYEVRSNYCNCNPEIFSLKGQNAMGTEFFIPGQNFLDNYFDFFPTPYNTFDIVATEDDTEIIIIPSNNASGITAGDTVLINLNMGQTYSVRALSQNANLHLGGSEVYSDKRISITMKDDLLAGFPFLSTCKDLGGDQIIPKERLGKEYILINSFLDGPGDQAFILAIEDNTLVYSNNTQVSTLNKGEIYQLSMGNANSMFVHADKPIAVLQMSGNGCEIGLAQLPHIECTGSQNISLTRSTNELFVVNLIVPTEGVDNFLVNGSNAVLNSTSFQTVEGTGGEWSYLQVSFNNQFLPIGSVLQIENTDYLFHSSVIHGGPTTGTRFGYFSDYSSIIQEFGILDKFYCPGSNLEYIIDSIQGAEYAWTGPNNFTSNTSSLIIEDLDIDDQGSYELIITNENCIDVQTEIELNIIENLEISLPEDTTLCYGLNYSIIPDPLEDEIVYTWVSPDNSTFAEDTLTINSINETNVGLYILEGIHPNCAVSSDSIKITIDSSFYTAASISSDQICEDGSVLLSILGEYTNPTWYGPNNIEYNGDSLYLDNIEITDAGVYYFTDQDTECGEISDSVTLEVLEEISLEANLDTDSLCIGENLQLNAFPANQGFALQWFGPNGFTSTEDNPSLTSVNIDDQGMYILTGSSQNCELVPDTVLVSVFSDTFITALVPDTICELANLIIDADLALDADYTISWGQGNIIDTPILPLTITNVNAQGNTLFTLNADNWICPVEGDSFSVYVDPLLDISAELSEDSVCLGQDVYLQANYFEDINYLWTGPNGFVADSSTFSIVNVDFPDSGYYTLSLSGEACLPTTDSTYLYITPPISPEIISEQDSLCAGESLVLSTPELEGITFNWTGPLNEAYEGNNLIINSVNDNNSGIYSLHVDDYPCPTPTSIIPIYVESNPLLILNDSICDNYFYELPNNVLVEYPGTYYVTETTALGCLQETEVNLRLKDCKNCYYFPNIFSPNNDGINDLWSPLLSCPVISYHFEIFDRWGNKVFTGEHEGDKWDGKIKGQNANPAVYVWHCVLLFEGQIEEIKLKGNLNLVR